MIWLLPVLHCCCSVSSSVPNQSCVEMFLSLLTRLTGILPLPLLLLPAARGPESRLWGSRLDLCWGRHLPIAVGGLPHHLPALWCLGASHPSSPLPCQHAPPQQVIHGLQCCLIIKLLNTSILFLFPQHFRLIDKYPWQVAHDLAVLTTRKEALLCSRHAHPYMQPSAYHCQLP